MEPEIVALLVLVGAVVGAVIFTLVIVLVVDPSDPGPRSSDESEKVEEGERGQS